MTSMLFWTDIFWVFIHRTRKNNFINITIFLNGSVVLITATTPSIQSANKPLRVPAVLPSKCWKREKERVRETAGRKTRKQRNSANANTRRAKKKKRQRAYVGSPPPKNVVPRESSVGVKRSPLPSQPGGGDGSVAPPPHPMLVRK